MESAFDTAPCGFLCFSDDGHILAVNDTLCAFLGYAREELFPARHVQMLFGPGGRVFYQTHLFPLLRLQGEVEEIYLSLRSKAGQEVPFLLNGRRRNKGTSAESECILMRMRQRSHFESELLNSKKTAEKANKAKDEFLAAISHELRTPLSPVLMMSSAMELDPGIPEEVRAQAGIIRRNAELEARLIDDLLDHTRITHGKLSLVPAPVDIHDLLQQTEEIVKSEGSGKRVTILFEKKAVHHHVEGDAARLQQVFWNVIKNAVKFTPTGGVVRVSTSNDGENRLVIRVTDTGIGIAPEVLPRIFNAFDQGAIAKGSFGGLGLGLAITQAIVDMHEGSIWAESEGLGRGATFSIALKTRPPVAPVPLREPVLTIRTGPLRLLLVEDHDSTREVLARILRRSGHDVHAAGTGAEALNLAAAATPFDALISDLGLPDQSGLDLIKHIRVLQPAIPAIALSGYGMDEDVERAKAAGFDAHLVKPVPLDHLRALLAQIAARKKNTRV